MSSIRKAITNGDLSGLRKYKVKLLMLKEYKMRPGGATPLDIFRIHRKGFTVNDWNLLGITDANFKDYISSKQYYYMHPLNSTYSTWIDDKLTLWYLCQGTELSENLPVYYFQIDDGKVLRLGKSQDDSQYGLPSVSAVADLLLEKKVLAIKQMKGSIGAGFYKAEYMDSRYFLNGEGMTRSAWCRRIESLSGYIICEYLRPHALLANVFPNTPNTFRYLAGRIDGELVFLKSFIRFGSTSTGYVENFNQGGVLCYIDENGHYDSGYIIDKSHGLSTRHVSTHPDTGVALVGQIPLWDKVQQAVSGFGRLFPQLEYVGFDFVVTNDERVIILEINSLTSLDAIQLDCSLLETPAGRKFFKSKM